VGQTYKKIRAKTKPTSSMTRPHSMTRERAKKQIRVRYLGIFVNGTIRFYTPSGTTSGRIWSQRVKLMSFAENRKSRPGKPLEVVRKSVAGDLKLFCNCPAFLYWGYKYIAWKRDYGLRQELRMPSIRNPRLQGSICKHLEEVLKVLPFNSGRITKSFKLGGLL